MAQYILNIQAKMPSWVCPACLKELNAAPYEQNDGEAQGNDHLIGKRHLRKMRHVDISNEDVYRRFCIAIGRSVPDFHATPPLHDLKDYTDQCGGNGELTIGHFAASPPPLPQAQDARRTLTCTERKICSVPLATVIPTDTTPMVGGRKCNVRMLCCWDDKNTCKGCLRKNCPFAHATKFADAYPEAEADLLYAVMPCNFAGMAGGCKYHQRTFMAHDWNWTVPVFKLTGRRDSPTTTTDSPRIDDQAVMMPELFPFYNGTKWSLRLNFNTHFEYAVTRYLDGFDDDSDNECSE